MSASQLLCTQRRGRATAVRPGGRETEEIVPKLEKPDDDQNAAQHSTHEIEVLGVSGKHCGDGRGGGGGGGGRRLVDVY